MSTFKAIKCHLKASYDKQNLTLVFISYEIYETRRRLVSLISYEMTTRVRSSVYVFCGVGTAWKGMCKTLMNNDVFKREINVVDDKLQEYTGWRIGNKFEKEKDVTSDPFTAHIAIFACQLDMAAIWHHFGIEADIVIGQSVGEVAAAYVSGWLSLFDAVKVVHVYYRSKFLSEIRSGTIMVIKGFPTTRVDEICKSLQNTVTIAVYISSDACTVSGSLDSGRWCCVASNAGAFCYFCI